MNFRVVTYPFILSTAILALTACSENDDRVRLYLTEAFAPSMTSTSIEALEFMGPVVVDKGVNFAVYSENATRLELLLFDDPESSRPTKRFPMEKVGNVWSLYVEGIGSGQHYGYVAWGPNWEYDEKWAPGTIHGFDTDVDSNGHRFNPNKLLIDPYAKALHRDHDWSKGSTASGPKRTESTWAAASKSLITESEHEWSTEALEFRKKRKDPNMEGHGWNELVVYEVHLKGLTADPASGVTHPGTYRGAGELAPYFAELGVNAVEFLPVHEKPLDGGYWGYNNLNFFAPEVQYASADEAREVLDEFKWMVDQYHQHGIEVWVDVVYNHTGEGGLWRQKLELNDTTYGVGEAELGNFDPHEVAGLYSFRGLDNAAYYALSADGLTYWNNTGVGNQMRTNHAPMRRLIIDSLRYYVEELHVDGFRFDLAPILGEKDLFYNEWDSIENTVLADIVNDEVLQENNTRIIAEPWSIQGFYLGQFPKSDEGAPYAWGEWNAHFRDVWRSFVNEDGFSLSSKEGAVDVGGTLTGSFDVYGDDGRMPYHSLNFVTVHDGFTMYDLFSYNEKQNKCGPLNPICCDNPLSAWCDKNSGEEHNRSRDWGEGGNPDLEPTKRQMMRNLFAAMLISHGTPLLYGGDEWMRTQLGNNNAYSTQADNDHNWFQWGSYKSKDEAHRMHDFVKKMITFRRQNLEMLSPTEYGGGPPFAWKSAQNTDTPNWGSRHIMMHYYGDGQGKQLAILINMERDWVEFTLPEGVIWERVVDTQTYFDTNEFLSENASDDLRASYNIDLEGATAITDPNYRAAGSSIVILQSAAQN